MAEPKSSATIRALADLAELSATQLEEGRSIDDVIGILRKAAQSVRSALEPEALKSEIPKSEVQDAETEASAEDFIPVDLNDELKKVEDLSA